MTQFLIAYHSHYGRTRRVAEALASMLDADLDEIREVEPRVGGFIGNTVVSWRALRGRASDIYPPVKSPAEHGITVVGTQVWANNLPPPVRSYITAERERIRRYAVFCTFGGRGAKRVIGLIEALVGRPAATTLIIQQGTMRHDAHLMRVRAFADTLRGLT